MISFDLRCGLGHVFEGWFRSSADFAAQRDGDAIACPLCGSIEIGKAVMAPAVAAKGNRRGMAEQFAQLPDNGEGPAPSIDADQAKAMLAALARAQAAMLERSQWVGDNFATRARAMHYGEAEHAQIHGTADASEARAMIEEGLPVAPLLIPTAPPDRTH